VEIYEGDVVAYEDGEWSFTAVIEWGDYGFYFEVVNLSKDSYQLDDWHDDGVLDVEVIGNRFANPELLEGEK